MNKIAWLPLAFALAATGACSRGAETANTPADRIAAAPAEQQATALAGEEKGGSQSVGLAEGGLTTGSPGLHHANLVEFGEPRAKVIADISAALGPPTGTGRNDECPSGPVDFASFGPLSLHFEEGRFAGWVIDEAGGPEIQTRHGLSFGDRRSEFNGGARIETVRDSTLGTELQVNGVGVLMSGPSPADRVTNLFAGVTCFAR